MGQQHSEGLPGKSRVVRLSFRKVGAEMNLSIHVRELATNDEVHLEFSNVSELQFLGGATGFDEIVSLRSEAAPTADGEPARLRVSDAEDDYVTFTCTGYRREN